MLQDLRFGLKLLWKEKAFTITALLTLALCIGANTAIFTVLHTVLLEPLPFPEPDRLVTVFNIYPGVGVTDHGANSAPDYFDRKQLTDVFESVALIQGSGRDIGSEGSPVRVDAQAVTPSYFHVLRASPLMGRLFTEDDATYKNDHYAILSYGLWKEKFASDPQVVGKDVRLSGQAYRVVGVMRQGFGSPGSDDTRMWLPFAFAPEQMKDEARHSNNFQMIARLKPGVSVAAAQKRIDALNQFQVQRSPYGKLLINARYASVVHRLKNELVRGVEPILYLLQGAVAFVLLIGCVNVANLLLVRSNIRLKELAIRHSLGAMRGRLARQLLTESLTLAVMGGLLGIGIGYAGVALLGLLGTHELPRGAGIHLDSGALAFSAAVTLITGFVFGSIPIYSLFRQDLVNIFRMAGRTGTSAKRAVWTRSALVVCQVSLAFILLIGAGLLAVSFQKLLAVNPGFQPQHVQTARFSLPAARYPDEASERVFENRLRESLSATPGIESFGLSEYLPFGGDFNYSAMSIVGHKLGPGELPPVPAWMTVDPGYFQTMGISLLQGRTFAESDSESTELAVVIDQYFARTYFPRGNAIGSQILRGNSDDPDHGGPPCRVIGIVATVKMTDMAEQKPVGALYFDYKQFPRRGMYVVAKTRSGDAGVANAVRIELQKADPELPLYSIKSMPDRVSASMRERKAAMVICLAFAGLAMLLSAIGIYGVLAYSVTQRTREIGIRLALGARGGQVVGMVIGQGLKLAGIGLAAGIVGAMALTRLITTLLFGVKPGDPRVFGAVAAALMAVALGASLIPSIRAVRVRPANALRYE